MGTYVVNVGDPTSPTDTQGAKQGAEELRALKALMAGFIVAGLAGSSVRQAIQSASLDANGYNNAITIGAGLRPALSATATPLHLSYAAGFNIGKPLNFDEVIAADNADILGVNLPLSNTSFLHKLWNGVYGNTLIPPQYGYAFDRTKQHILNFEGINGAVTTTDDGGDVCTLTGASLSTAQFKFGASSLGGLAGAQYATMANFTSLGDGSWQLETWIRPTSIAGTQLIWQTAGSAFGCKLYASVGGVGKLVAYLSSNGTADDIGAGLTGATTLVINTWYKVRMIFDALAGSYKVFLSNNGAAETTEITQASTARICALTGGFRIGADNGGANGFIGNIDAFRHANAALNTSSEVPAAVAPTITDYLITFYSIPQMKMFDVTAASAAGGVNPTLTAVNRLFLGEADTSGVAVTAVRNYAVRGQYRSALTPISAANVATSFNHNIGVEPSLVKVSAKFINLTASQGYKPGMVASDPFPYFQTGTSEFTGPCTAIDGRNTAKIIMGNTGLILWGADASAAFTITPSSTSWTSRLVAERTW